MNDKRTIDEIDHKILVILQDKARIPNAEVARQVGMAPSAVLERIRKLEERGIIDGYEVRLNPHAFNQNLTAFVQLTVQPASAVRLRGALQQISGVQDIYQVAGEDGYLIKIRVADNAELATILTDEIAPLEGVVQTRTSIALNTIKESRRINLDHI